MKKRLWLAVIVAAGMQTAGWGNIYTAASGLWSDGTIWSDGVPPGVEDEAWIRNNGHVTLDSAAGSIVSLRVAQLANAVGSLTVTSDGSLTTTTGMVVGDRDNAHGTLTLNGGAVTSGGDVRIAGGVTTRTNVTGSLNINGGLFDASGKTLHAGFGSTGSSGTVNMTGGTLKVEILGVGNDYAVGMFNLDGGHLFIGRNAAAGASIHATNGTFTITDGILEWAGARVANVTTAVGAGLISWGGTTTNMLPYVTGFQSWTNDTEHVLYAARGGEDNNTYVWSTALDAGDPDTDGDGIPDWWEELYFGGATNAVASAPAANGANTVLEAYVAGLDPTNPQSSFGITGFNAASVPALLEWNAVSGRVYTVHWTPDLVYAPFVEVGEVSFPEDSFSDGSNTNNTGFYKLGVRLAP